MHKKTSVGINYLILFIPPIFRAGGHENVLLNIEVIELSQTTRLTRSMTQDVFSVKEQNARLSMFHQHQHQQFHFTARELQRLARDAISQAVLVDLKRH